MLLHLLERRPRLHRLVRGVLSRVCEWAAVSNLHRFLYPASLSTSRVKCTLLPGGGADLGDHPEQLLQRRDGGTKSATGPAGPTRMVNSVPVIGWTPNPLQAWTNSIDPQTPSWSVSAKAGYP